MRSFQAAPHFLRPGMPPPLLPYHVMAIHPAPAVLPPLAGVRGGAVSPGAAAVTWR